MKLASLDHFTVRCGDLDRSLGFYRDLLGLVPGARPDFAFDGAWLYLCGRAVVHLIAAEAGEAGASGAFDHVAFLAEDIEAARARLAGRDVRWDEADVPGMPLRQIFLTDPDGVKVELTFTIA